VQSSRRRALTSPNVRKKFEDTYSQGVRGRNTTSSDMSRRTDLANGYGVAAAPSPKQRWTSCAPIAGRGTSASFSTFSSARRRCHRPTSSTKRISRERVHQLAATFAAALRTQHVGDQPLPVIAMKAVDLCGLAGAHRLPGSRRGEHQGRHQVGAPGLGGLVWALRDRWGEPTGVSRILGAEESRGASEWPTLRCYVDWQPPAFAPAGENKDRDGIMMDGSTGVEFQRLGGELRCRNRHGPAGQRGPRNWLRMRPTSA
jgi:hypothetical protein